MYSGYLLAQNLAYEYATYVQAFLLIVSDYHIFFKSIARSEPGILFV